MTTLTNTPTPPSADPASVTSPPGAASRFASHDVSLAHVTRSEWIKLTTLRSTWWSAVCVIVLAVGISGLAAVTMTLNDSVTSEVVASMTITFTTLPIAFVGLLATVLGSMFITGEYSTGMIRSTLTTAPDRTRSLAAKMIVVSAFVFAISLIASLLSFVVVTAVFAVGGVAQDFSDPAALFLPYLRAALYMVALALMGLGIGYTVRTGAGAIAIAAGIVFVLPIIASILAIVPGMDWVYDAAEYLPLNAGAAFVQGGEKMAGSALALAGFAVVPLLTGYGLLKSRDA